MRPLWTGAISFGLVNIPVGLYPAITHKPTVDLDLLRDSDLSRIHYKKVAEADGKEVPREHIVKGYEYAKDQYVVLSDEDFRRVEIKSNQTVDIREFVELAQIEPLYFNEPYFLAPERGGAKAYTLLRTALEKTGLAGVAKVVIRPPREHLALLKPLNGVLLLETLHFPDELRNPAELNIPKGEIGDKELEMALALIHTMKAPWSPAKYHDEYRECLMKIIEQKVQAGARKLPPPEKTQRKAAPNKIIDLVGLLQQSLGGSEKPRKAKASRHKTAQKKAA